MFNFDKLEQINHIHCLEYIFRPISFADFISLYFMIFTLNPIMSETFIIQQNVFIFTMAYC